MEDRPVEGMLEPAPRRRGCLFWGCVTTTLLIVIVGGCTVFLGFYLTAKLKEFTSEQPAAFEPYQVKPGQREALEGRLRRFETAADAGDAGTLELTEDDFNLLLAEQGGFLGAGGKARVRIEGEQVLVDVSIPLDDLFPPLAGRYFNGTAAVSVAIVNGRLVGFLEGAEVDGRPVPEEFLAGVRTENIFKDLRDGKLADFISKARSLEVKEGRVILSR